MIQRRFQVNQSQGLIYRDDFSQKLIYSWAPGEDSVHLAELKSFFLIRNKARSMGMIYVVFTLRVSILEKENQIKYNYG